MNEKKKLENSLELTPEMLEMVSGGIMTDSAEKVLTALIKVLRNDPNATHTAQETIDFVTAHFMDNKNFEGVTEKDVEDFINAHWDSEQ